MKRGNQRISQLFLICFVQSASLLVGEAYSQFTTTLNIPSDPGIGNFQTIGSDTQVNLFDGGTIGFTVDAGVAGGTSTNIEVNVAGGFVAGHFNANSGSTVNISGGTVHVLFDAFDGSTVNISGGSVGSFFTAYAGSMVDISGGSVGSSFDAFSGSAVHISGGSIASFFEAFGGSEVTISGSDFRLDGVLISGLNVVGNTMAFDPPLGTVLSGTLADGTPFAFSSLDFDRIDEGTLTLAAVALPDIGSPVIMVPSEPVPLGIGIGQALVVNNGGSISDNFNAGWGSTVIINGGQVGKNFEAVGSEVTISGGSVDGLFDAFSGSVVTITGGSVGGSFQASDGSTVNISGGSVEGFFRANNGSTVTISGGQVGRGFDAFSGSTVTISGGMIGDDFDAFSGSLVNLIGTEFVVDGINITASLLPFTPTMVNVRDITLSGLLSDGSPFSFDLNSGNVFDQDFFGTGATLVVTLVPEPSTLMIGALGLFCLVVRRSFG